MILKIIIGLVLSELVLFFIPVVLLQVGKINIWEN